jgi:hypothetical protein
MRGTPRRVPTAALLAAISSYLIPPSMNCHSLIIELDGLQWFPRPRLYDDGAAGTTMVDA